MKRVVASQVYMRLQPTLLKTVLVFTIYRLLLLPERDLRKLHFIVY